MDTHETKQLDQDITMKSVLYTMSVIMVFAWALCFFVYSLNTFAHLLLIFAVIIGVIGILRKN